MAVFGRSWAVLGSVLRPLGPLLAALSRFWTAPGRHTHTFRRPKTHTRTHRTAFKNHQKIDAKNDRFRPPKSPQKPPKMTPKSNQKTIKNRCSKSMAKMTDLDLPKPPKMIQKSDQKATKNRFKKRSEKRTDIRPSWGRLGTILGRFGTDLGL